MPSAKAVKPRPGRLLMGLQPDTRVVIADVTWNDYARLVDAVAEGENCRVAYDGKDVELMNVGPVHDSYSAKSGVFSRSTCRSSNCNRMGSMWRLSAAGSSVSRLTTRSAGSCAKVPEVV